MMFIPKNMIVTKEKEDDDIAQIFVDMLEADIKDIREKENGISHR